MYVVIVELLQNKFRYFHSKYITNERKSSPQSRALRVKRLKELSAIAWQNKRFGKGKQRLSLSIRRFQKSFSLATRAGADDLAMGREKKDASETQVIFLKSEHDLNLVSLVPA